MSQFNLVRYHVLSGVRAAVAQSTGDEVQEKRLQSQAKLRLCIMSEEELRELARMLSFLPSRPSEDVYQSIQEAKADHMATVDQWVESFGVKILKEV
jgi:hypothetical protein